MEQRIRFCAADDGVRLAYAVHGRGPELVRAGSWMTHLEYDGESPLWRHWLTELGRSSTVIRYDERGSGLSTRDLEGREVSLDAWVGDLETVVSSAGVEEFDLWGISQGAALAVEYAARHPARVRKMVLFGGYARGRARWSEAGREQSEMRSALIEAGWGRADHAFQEQFARLLFPGATPAEIEPIRQMQRRSASGSVAARGNRARGEVDVTGSATRVRAPTLVMHALDDVMVPIEQGLELASLIPHAQFLALEGRNHLVRADDDAWPTVVAELTAFLDRSGPAPDPALASLTGRETEVLRMLATGLSNEEIAAALVLSRRTVERHLSTVYLKLGLGGRNARAAAVARYAGRS